MRAKPHPREVERLAALRSFGVLDTPRDQRFDKIVELAAELCQAPIAVINLIDEHRQWFKSEVGLGVRETPLETSLCAHVILQPGLTVIPDTLADARMRDNPLCLGAPNLRFYAGAVLETDDGLPLGTLCILDHQPRDLSDQQRRVLSTLAEQVMSQLQLKRQLRKAQELSEEVDHRVRNSLSLVQAFLMVQSRQIEDEDSKRMLGLASARVSSIAQIHDQLHRSGSLTEVDLHEFVTRLAASLGQHAPENVTISVDMPTMIARAREGTNIGILLNEFITNAFRHAFPDGRAGHVSVKGERRNHGLALSIADDGVGLPEGFDPEKASGLGMRLARSLVKQFGGELNWATGRSGTAFTFHLPLQR
jgi:two-component sensor histidine kinase